MRIMVNATRARKGGGIPLALGALRMMPKCTSHEWHVVVSPELGQEISADQAQLFASYRVHSGSGGILLRTIRGRRQLTNLEAQIKPGLVFTVNGPTYWRPASRHLFGFALPYVLYPDSIVFRWLSPYIRMRMNFVVRAAIKECRQANIVAVETETVRQRLHRVAGVPLDKIVVVRTSYNQLFADEIIKHPLASRPDIFTIAIPSAYYIHKNLEFLAGVSRILKAALPKPFEFVFTIPTSDPGWGKIQAAATKAGVNDCIRTLGHVKHREIARLYRSADLVCLPTLLECSSGVYPEAFMSEVPVVTSDMDFTREVCGEGALYFDPHNADSAAQAIVQGLTDTDCRQKLIEQGRISLKTNYPSPDEKWRNQLALIDRMLGQPASMGACGSTG